MQRAIGAKTKAVLAERDVAGIIAVEILAKDFFGAFADASAQRFADTDAFARDPYGHVMPRFSKVQEISIQIGGSRSSRCGVAGPVRGYGWRRKCIAEHTLFVAAALHRRWNAHRLAVFRHGTAGDINTGFAQSFHDGVVRQDCSRAF